MPSPTALKHPRRYLRTAPCVSTTVPVDSQVAADFVRRSLAGMYPGDSHCALRVWPALWQYLASASAGSSYVCPVDDAAESFVAGVVVAPDDVPADHAGLFFMAGMVGAVQCEVPERRELRFYAV